MQNSRTIILHYHLFKNAGTSIDAILKDNFDEKWVTREFESSNSNKNMASDLTDLAETLDKSVDVFKL